MLISSAFAQDAVAAAKEPSLIASLAPLVLILAIFYVLILRPQQKRYKDHQQMQQALKKGDKIITGGGLLGKVVKTDEGNDLLHVEIAEGVVVKAARATIASAVDAQSDAKDMTQQQSSSKKSKIANDN